MKAHLISTIVLISLSPFAFCCDNPASVDAVLLGGRAVQISKPAQRESKADPGGGSMCGVAYRPIYPKAARAARIQGHVIMAAIIDKSGSVSHLKLISGHPLLVNAAMEAVKDWKYKPYLFKGKRVPVKTTIDVDFSLSGG